MAPNLKHVTLLSDPLCNLEVSRPKEALNQQSLTQQSKTVNSDNYWAWTSEPDRTADLFSADHLEANLINYSQSKPSTTATFSSKSSSDNYWAEQDQDIRVESQPQHAEVESASPAEFNSYWQWSNEKTESDHYWNFNEPKQIVDTVVRTPAESDSYWQWSNAATESDVYWSEATTCHKPSDNYWTWSSSQTASDRYWDMSSAIAL
jgi:phage-related protein